MIVNNIIFDFINFSSFFKIIFFFRKKNIYLFLEKKSIFEIIYLLIIKFLKIKIVIIENFHAGDIKKNNQSISLEAFSYTNKNLNLILEKLSIWLKKEKFINSFNYKYLKLYLAKLIQPELYQLYLKYFLFDHFVPNKKKIFLKQLNFINEDLSHDIKYLQYINFYKKNSFLLVFILIILKDCINYFYGILTNFIKKKTIQDLKKKNKILTYHSDTISLDESYRSQSYWFNKKRAVEENLNLFVLKNDNLIKPRSIPKNLEKNNVLNSNNIFIISSSFIFFYNTFFKQLKNFLRYFLCFKKENFQKKFLFLKIIIFFNYKNNLKKFIKINNFKVIVFEENYSIFADASCLAANEVKKKTVSFQYSNHGIVSVPMIALCDLQIIYSKNFKKIYRFEDFAPKEFYIAGDIFINKNIQLLYRANKIKKIFNNNGVNFIICYFDERIDYSKFGNNSIKSNLEEVEKLISFVLNNKDIGLITKSQFIKYSLTRVYPFNKNLKKLLKLGRYIELEKGLVNVGRNDVLPIEPALISDICISQKYGATAGLTSAIVGKKTILLNRHGYKTAHDNIYNNSRSKICYDSIDESLKDIKNLKNKKKINVGNWEDILNYFSSRKDLDPRDRVMNKISDLVQK
jgi:hypothetical protein